MARKPKTTPLEGAPAKGPSSPQRVAKGRGAPQTLAAAYDELAGPSAAPSATVVDLPAPRNLRAFELLAVQPISLVGMTPAERYAVVVTAVADDAGREYVVSRFGDRVWDLASKVEPKNRKGSNVKIVWPDDVPQALVDDAKAALYCALRRGPHGRKWSGSMVVSAGNLAGLVVRHFAFLGLTNFGQLRALHLSDYIADLRHKVKPQTAMMRLLIVDLVWSFYTDVLHPLPEHPWAGLALWDACGCNEEDGGPAGRTGKTPVIPRSVQRTLFAHCEAQLNEAEVLFRARDAGKIGPSKPECVFQTNSRTDSNPKETVIPVQRRQYGDRAPRGSTPRVRGWRARDMGRRSSDLVCRERYGGFLFKSLYACMSAAVMPAFLSALAISTRACFSLLNTLEAACTSFATRL